MAPGASLISKPARRSPAATRRACDFGLAAQSLAKGSAEMPGRDAPIPTRKTSKERDASRRVLTAIARTRPLFRPDQIIALLYTVGSSSTNLSAISGEQE